MTIEVLDMPDLTELPEDALLRRQQRSPGAVERTPAGDSVPASVARPAAVRIRDPILPRKRDGSA